MNKYFALMCGIVMISFVAKADETTCADGTGIVITGKSGYAYCRSNNNMNWWNAVSWCDAQGRRLFVLDDCGCDSTINCTGICPELRSLEGVEWTDVWTMTPISEIRSYFLHTSGAITINSANGNRSNSGMFRALCY